nr:hypothetical protein [Candidatus Sigynarchaeota archaeon]
MTMQDRLLCCTKTLDGTLFYVFSNSNWNELLPHTQVTGTMTVVFHDDILKRFLHVLWNASCIDHGGHAFEGFPDGL